MANMDLGYHAQEPQVQKKLLVDIRQHVSLVYPRQSVLITSGFGAETNIGTLAWTTILSNRPPIQGIVVTPGRFTYELIDASKKFIINIPDRSLINEFVGMGQTTGRLVDKFEKFGLTPLESIAFGENGPPRIAECPVHVECRVVQQVPFGDHVLFAGEVVSCSVNEELVKDGLYIPNKIKIPYHLGGHQFTFNEQKVHSF
ncbi:MAG: flavin reductase family protein [Promethearchaeota archaeon]